MEKIIDVWSDNWEAREVIDIIHDFGYETAGMHREVIGDFEENVEWSRCKTGELPAMCVSLIHDDGACIHSVEEIAEKPLFLYKLVLIVPDMPKGTEDTTEEEEQEQEEEKEMKHDVGSEKEINVVMNIGLTTQDGKQLDMDTVVNMVGLFADCTITPTIGFYKGVRENSIKVEIYDYKATAAFTLAAHFARSFNQECVALTANGYTAFISQHPTNEEYKTFVERVDK